MSKANFNESRKIGVELVSRDASGNLLTWRENGYDMAVARDASGNVTTLTASGPAGSYKMTIQRDAKGNYIGQTGDYLQSAMLPEINSAIHNEAREEKPAYRAAAGASPPTCKANPL